MKKRIYLIRHAETDFNRQKIVQGSGVNTAINSFGVQQSTAFFQAYKHLPFGLLITSSLLRTHQTVQKFIDRGIPWIQYEEINEISWGDQEGKSSTAESMEQYLEMKKAWIRGEYDAKIPNGESALELSERVSTFVQELKNRKEELILICSHGRTMRCLMTHFKEEPLLAMEQYHHSNTGLYMIDFDGIQFHVHMENDIQHLNSLVA